MDREQLKLNLKVRRESAIKNGRVFSSDKSESFFANEATDWTYQDFQDATQILINRLNQLLTVCDTDNPGPEQAKLMHKIGNMTRIYSDKIDRVFNQDLPVKQIKDVETNDEKVLSDEVISELGKLFEESEYLVDNDMKDQNKLDKDGMKLHFTANTDARFAVKAFLDISKMGTQLNCTITCQDPFDKTKIATSNFQPQEDAQAIMECIHKVFDIYDKQYGEQSPVAEPVGVETLYDGYRLKIDTDVLNIL